MKALTLRAARGSNWFKYLKIASRSAKARRVYWILISRGVCPQQQQRHPIHIRRGRLPRVLQGSRIASHRRLDRRTHRLRLATAWPARARPGPPEAKIVLLRSLLRAAWSWPTIARPTQKSERPRGEPRPLDGGGGAGYPPQP